MSEGTEKLKALGLRITPQRLAVLAVIRGTRTHLSVDKIYKNMLKKYPGGSFGTVYNILSRLVDAGEIQELDIDPKKKRFDPCTLLHYIFTAGPAGRFTTSIVTSPQPQRLEPLAAIGLKPSNSISKACARPVAKDRAKL